MRLVDLQTFLAMPPDTLFSLYEPCSFDRFGLKRDNFCDGDFWWLDLTRPEFEGSRDPEDRDDVLDAMERGEPSPPLDLDFVGRSGPYKPDQLFAVYERADVEAIITRLQQSLEPGGKWVDAVPLRYTPAR